MIVMGKLDKNEEESLKWVRENLRSCTPNIFPHAKMIRAESLIEALAGIRFIQHDTIRTLAALATKIQDLAGRLGELDKLVEAQIKRGVPK